MKTIRKLFTGTILAVLALVVTNFQPVQTEETITVYQVYSPVSKEHLYTTDAAEVVSRVRNQSWQSEGTGWITPVSGEPVFRVSNSKRGDYIYTTQVSEVNELVSNGWKDDFNSRPVFYSGGSIPVYKLINNKTGRHYYTSSTDEYNTLANQNWSQEGIAFYALGSGSPLAGPSDISNTESNYAIQADVKLSGNGSGYHAKILAQTPTSAVSFGLQFDTGGLDSYKDHTGFIIENIYSNAKGGQAYYRPGLAKSDQVYRMLLTVSDTGVCTFYVNGISIGESVTNPNLANTEMDVSVEGSGKRNGDSVTARFENIKVKNSASYDSSKWFKPVVRDTNLSIHSDISNFSSDNSVTISGTVSGLGEDQDWDNAYNSVSGITTFYE